MRLSDAVFEHMDLEQKEQNLFSGAVEDHGMGRVFGGQVVGQALLAATRTTEGKPCHSLHGYFLRAGDPKEPVFYEVDRIRDGGSFSTRQVVAKQKGKAILSLSASFQQFEDGLEHQIEMPNVPGPDEFPTEEQMLEQRRVENPDVDDRILTMVHCECPAEIRRVEDHNYFQPKKMSPVKHIWYRSKKKLGDDNSKHQCLLAYVSDMGLLSTSTMPHGKSGVTGLQMASIDHSIWFHRPFKFDDWILIAMDSTISANSRGYVRASMFTQDGTLIASAVQEGLVRVRV